ncbi:hypothetical protein [Mycolicibacterium sp. OfavD-34-C]|uniref:hypothetical protein n=1 Tax=Mycolicibacterium sp. OfavD-34-C TaxID=2917746 RepID=UPI001EF3DEDE|nr:hypothetical protein [Mycolicibacterium sp. OfavD-34-C]MCG7582790.1 hypothetical protein [Mycolicibacterium sp. OfavD-34-C]
MTTTIPAGGTREYLADRYDRLRNGAEIIASDPNVAESESMFGAEGLRAFTESVIDARLLDGLSEYDADTVSLLITLDFLRGPDRMAWRIHEWINGNTLGRDDGDNADAVLTVLALALALVLSAFAGPEFQQGSRMAQMFDGPEKSS